MRLRQSEEDLCPIHEKAYAHFKVQYRTFFMFTPNTLWFAWLQVKWKQDTSMNFFVKLNETVSSTMLALGSTGMR